MSEMRRRKRYAELLSPDAASARRAEAARKVPLNTDRREEKRAHAMADVFMKQEKDTQTSIELYFKDPRRHTGTDDWTLLRLATPIAKILLPRFKGPELAQAAAKVMKDDEGRWGAARWFFGTMAGAIWMNRTASVSCLRWPSGLCSTATWTLER